MLGENDFVDTEYDKPYVAFYKFFFLRAALRLLDEASFLVKGNFRIFADKIAIGFEHNNILYDSSICA